MTVILLAFLLGCEVDPHDYKIPADVSSWANEKDLKPTIAKLSEDEQNAMARYATRKVLTGGLPEGGVTIGDALKDQTAWEAEVAARKSEEEALAAKVMAEKEQKSKELRAAVVVAVTNLGFEPLQVRGGYVPAHFEISLAFENKTDKDIQGVKGSVVFSDLFGDEVKSVGFAYDEGVKAKSTASWDASIEYNQFVDSDKRLGATSLDKLKVSWMPETVIFTDGSSLSAK